MSDLTDAARKTADDLNGPNWVNATFGARERLHELADRVDEMEDSLVDPVLIAERDGLKVELTEAYRKVSLAYEVIGDQMGQISRLREERDALKAVGC